MEKNQKEITRGNTHIYMWSKYKTGIHFKTVATSGEERKEKKLEIDWFNSISNMLGRSFEKIFFKAAEAVLSFCKYFQLKLTLSLPS